MSLSKEENQTKSFRKLMHLFWYYTVVQYTMTFQSYDVSSYFAANMLTLYNKLISNLLSSPKQLGHNVLFSAL